MLSQAIKVLGLDSKICIFVHGLDEFNDRHEVLIGLIKRFIMGNKYVKVCTTSRPWNIFQTALGHSESLRVEDLTFDDIKVYVKAKFHANTEFKILRRRYPAFADQLLENIVAKASGVFLWVDIIVKSLLAGMRLVDRIQDFQRRLDKLPPDLENLYEKILPSLDPFYLKQAAQQFALIKLAESPLTILEFSFADEETPESAIRWGIGSMTEDQISLRVTAANRRLNSRTKGFLEADRGLQSIQAGGTHDPSKLTVQYLHRTVKDFIKSPKAQSFLQSSRDPNFDPYLQLCLAYLINSKVLQKGVYSYTLSSRKKTKNTLAASIANCFGRATRISTLNEKAMIRLLEELKETFQRPFLMYSIQDFFNDERQFIKEQWQTRMLPRSVVGSDVRAFSLRFSSLFTIDKIFLILAVRHNVISYVRAKAQQDGLIQCSERPRVYFPLLLYAIFDNDPEPEMVKCLLDMGAYPNFRMSKYKSHTLWNVVLYILMRPDHQGNVPAEDKWKQSSKLMLMRGANGEMVPSSRHGRKMLQELKDELGKMTHSWSRPTRWLRLWTQGCIFLRHAHSLKTSRRATLNLKNKVLNGD